VTPTTTRSSSIPTAQEDDPELSPERIAQIRAQFLRRGFTDPLIIIDTYDAEEGTVSVEALVGSCSRALTYYTHTGQIGFGDFSDDTDAAEILRSNRWTECAST
jgi:hypothetical protein